MDSQMWNTVVMEQTFSESPRDLTTQRVDRQWWFLIEEDDIDPTTGSERIVIPASHGNFGYVFS